MLLEQGGHGLSMRKPAMSCNASTMVLFIYFQNKQGLMNALYRDGFGPFRLELKRVPEDPDPMVHLMELGRAFCRAVLVKTNAYERMMSRSLHEFSLPEERIKQGGSSFSAVAEAVTSRIGGEVMGD